METDIDIVITWVDGDDPEWRKLRNQYANDGELEKPDVGGKERYEDNGLLKYLFRGLDKFAPWAHRIYFVTWGHLPPWLNEASEKLRVIRHQDFIPKDYLPTFNSAAIALNLHRIPGLSERFVYFNDDMYLLSETKPALFFKDGLPRDMAVNEVMQADSSTAFWHATFNDVILLNQTYRKKAVIKSNRKKWYALRYGRGLIKNIALSPFNMFSAFYEPHLPASYLKSEFEFAWNTHFSLLDATCKSRFRNGSGLTENFIRYSQMAKGSFVPINKDHYGFYASIHSRLLPGQIKSGKFKYICINDNADQPASPVLEAFNSLLPEKCGFEL